MSAESIAYLPDHDHVGVGTHERAEPGGEAQAALLVDLDLLDPVELVLHRILDRYEGAVGRVDLGHRGVQRGGLARSRGAGHEYGAVRSPDGAPDALAVGLAHAQAVEVHHHLALVEDAHDHGFAPHHRERGHAQVHVPALDRQPDTPVLGQALLGDVELGHDLDARNQPRDQMARDVGGVEDHAVDAEAHAHVRGARLEVNIRRSPPHGVGDDGVN